MPSEPLTMALVDRLIDEVADTRGVTVLEAGAPMVTFVFAAIRAAGALAPEVGTAAGLLGSLFEGRSLTFYVPGMGKVIYLSLTAGKDARTKLETFAHELAHCDQIDTHGAVQAAEDYLGSGQMRAKREAEGVGSARAVRFALDGHLPPAADALEKFKADTYHLASEDAAFALAVVEAIDDSATSPPIRAARDVIAWLRAKAPQHLAA